MGYPYTPSMSNFILLETGPGAKDCYDYLLRKHGVIVRLGDTWGLPEHLRITVGTEDENVKLIEGLAQWNKEKAIR
jgi:histidinol-phosphate aminotransferase